MTQKISLGQWKNAPLAMVVASIFFNEKVDPQEVCRKIKDLCSDIFTVEAETQKTSIDLTNNEIEENSAVPSGILLRNDENSYSIHITVTTITFFASKYTNHQNFLKLWQKIISPLFLSPKEVTFCGMRYIDFIIPSENREISEYIVGLDTPPARISLEVTSAFNAYTYALGENKELRLMYFRYTGEPQLPPEFLGIVKVPNNLIKPYIKGRDSAVLDIDCVDRTRSMRSLKEIEGTFLSFHKNLSITFKSVISDVAKNEWNP